MTHQNEICTHPKASTLNYAILFLSLNNRTWIFFFLLSLSVRMSSSQKNGYFLCNPFQPATCRFGGQCSSMSTVPRLSIDGDFEPGEYVCRCEAFDCSALGFDPVCGDNGQTYVNDACRRAQECANQAPIERRCKGICGKSDCQEILDTTLRCPPNESGRCTNFGECLISEQTGEPYCSCLKGYIGPRCELRLIDPRNVKTQTGQCSEESAYKIAFLCVIAILGLVLILQTAYCIIRYREATNKESSFTENGQKDVRQNQAPTNQHLVQARGETSQEETFVVDNDG